MATVQSKVRLTRLWFHESKTIMTVQRCFPLEYRNCQSPSKNSIERWYEQFKGTGNVHHEKGAGRPLVSDEVVERPEATPKIDQVAHAIEGVANLASFNDLKVDSDGVQELFDADIGELTTAELIKMHEQIATVEAFTSDPDPPENQVTIGSLTESICLLEKGLQVLETMDFNEEHIATTGKESKRIRLL
ncbi:hypothetical protein AVEN_217638-1 [Araneus ventricosus]|uniref:DUF4817 domain-containing protein n=1 Tax=Araneus ventricosus TaxID=182803 RepID=A0A4Y2HJW9_ARAVE|nr:hypothetical protein AVEN_217638-1 [Araneus ventricosus]